MRPMSLVLAAAVIIVLPACSSDAATSSSTNPASTSTAASTRPGAGTSTVAGATTTVASPTSPATSPATTAAPTTIATSGTPYVVVHGDTLSAIARAHGVTLAALVAANGWADGTAHAIFPGDHLALPAGAVTPTTVASTSTSAVATSGATTQTTVASSTGLYRSTGTQYDGPDFGDRTAPITSPLADGAYWGGQANVTAAGKVTFVLNQQFFGDACVQQFGTDPEMCLDNTNGLDATATVAFADDGTVTVIDSNDIAALRITRAELVRLLAGKAPAADAPKGFRYVGFPFIVTVRNGVAVAADQHFVS